MTDDKSYIIDPLTALCKLALLHFMPDGTKLGISNHVLYIQVYNYYQWIERKKNGDSRRDISNLDAPIVKAIKWYILDTKEKEEMDAVLIDSVRSITKFTILGLQKLQTTTYTSDRAIRIILQYLINILRDSLNDIWNDENIVKIESDNNILTDKIKNNYEIQTINSIAKMLTDANSSELSTDDINALVDCVHKLLINRDTIFVKLMRDINTTL